MFHDGTQGTTRRSYKPPQRKGEARNERTTYQLGSFVPAFVSLIRASKKSSTEWPMLTGGSSRLLFPAARILRSCIHLSVVRWYESVEVNARSPTSWTEDLLRRRRYRTREERYPRTRGSIRRMNECSIYTKICKNVIPYDWLCPC